MSLSGIIRFGFNNLARLPTKWVKAEIIFHGHVSRAHIGAVNDLAGVISENFEGQGMANMLGNANKMPSEFAGARRKVRVIYFVVDGLPPVKTEEGTDVRCASSQKLEWNSFDGDTIGMVEEETNIHHGQEPGAGRRPRTVKKCICGALDGLKTAFSRVLLLLVRLTLPTRDT